MAIGGMLDCDGGYDVADGGMWRKVTSGASAHTRSAAVGQPSTGASVGGIKVKSTTRIRHTDRIVSPKPEPQPIYLILVQRIVI